MNHAKVRPCSEEQFERYREGARRKLRVVHVGSTSHEALLEAIGHRAEMVLRIEGENTLPSDGTSENDAADATTSIVRSMNTVATCMDFSSVGAACAAKEILDKGGMEDPPCKEAVAASRYEPSPPDRGGDRAGRHLGIISVNFVVEATETLPLQLAPSAANKSDAGCFESIAKNVEASRHDSSATPTSSDEGGVTSAAMRGLLIDDTTPREERGLS